MGGLPMLLLTVPSRRSEALHTVPVVYFHHDGRYLVVGTGMGGSKKTPQWFRNLAAAAAPKFGLPTRTTTGARVASAAEREQLRAVIAARAPHFDKWQARIGRRFPVAVRAEPSDR
jgi:deazaflavin-dependent oxidoreductase (nitroreductase family)